MTGRSRLREVTVGERAAFPVLIVRRHRRHPPPRQLQLSRHDQSGVNDLVDNRLPCFREPLRAEVGRCGAPGAL